MDRLSEGTRRIVILGAGAGGSAMLDLLSRKDLVDTVDIVAVVDQRTDAPGIQRAKELEIPVFDDVEEALHASAPCVAFNLTGSEIVENTASNVLGAKAVIGGVEARLIWRMVTDLRDARSELEFQATHDELTGLYNRRHMLAEMTRELLRVIRYNLSFSVALIDLDHFKAVNDMHGHAAGDLILKCVAALLKSRARSTDVIGRWGGEEFLVMLPHATADDAKCAVEKWLADVKQKPVEVSSNAHVSVSFSAGVATFNKHDESAEINEVVDRLLARADERLYEAKSAGRGCVISGG